MTTRSRILACTALVALTGTAATALPLNGDLSQQNIKKVFGAYEFIEVRVGNTQVKVEAVDNNTNTKIEVVYAKDDGRILSSETEAAGDDAGRVGFDYASVARDFEEDDSTGEDDLSDDDADDLTDSDDDDTGSDDSGDDTSGSDDDDDGNDDDSGSDDS